MTTNFGNPSLLFMSDISENCSFEHRLRTRNDAWYARFAVGSDEWSKRAKARSRSAPARLRGRRDRAAEWQADRTRNGDGELCPENRGLATLTQDGTLHEHDRHRQPAALAPDRRHDSVQARPAEATRHSQLSSCERFRAWLGRSPDAAMADEVRLVQMHLVVSGASICNRNRIMTGVRFLFGVTLRH